MKKTERKILMRERKSQVKHTLMREKSRKETKRDRDEFLSYYGFHCDERVCFGV